MRFLCRLCLFIAFIQFLPGLQAAERLTLLDTLPEPDASSNPANFKRVGNLLFFNANGTEIWVTDGTEAGTRKTSFTGTIDDTYYASDTALYRYKVSSAYATPSLVEYKDGPEGPLQATLIEIQTNASSDSNSIAEFKGEVYFRRDNYRVWACKRGTPDTFRVIYQGFSWPRDFTIDGDYLYFSAQEFVNSYTANSYLYRTDGINVSQVLGHPGYGLDINKAINGVVFYSISSGLGLSYDVYKSNSLIVHFSVFDYDIRPTMHFRGETLYFLKPDNTGTNIWRSGDDPPTAYRTTDLNPSSGSEVVKNLTLVGEDLFFSVNGTEGRELWKLDSADQATIVKDITPGAGSTEFYAMGEVDGMLYFYCKAECDRVELWKSDGTPEGTVRIKHIGYGKYTEHESSSINGKFVFTASNPESGSEPYVSDGTDAGTGLLQNIGIAAGSTLSTLSPVTSWNQRVYFRRAVNEDEILLYSSEAIPAGTKQIGGGSPRAQIRNRLKNNAQFKTLNLENCFIDNVGDYFVSYKGDGSFPEKILSFDDFNGGYSDIPYSPRVVVDEFNGKLYFQSGYGKLPIISDGTLENTVHLSNYLYHPPLPGPWVGGPQIFYPFILGVSGSNVLVAGSVDVSGNDYELYRSNGTSAGTKLVKDIDVGQNSSGPSYGQVAGNLVYFRATTPEAGAELWRTNGYESGTKLVEDIVPGTGSSYPFCLGATDADVMIFSANGNEIWRSNGNAAGTYLLKDTLEGTTSRSFEYVGTHLGKVYVSARYPNELWVSDGTVAGTKKIADAASFANHYRYLGPVGDYLFVTNPAGQICATDGSAFAVISTNFSQGFFSDKYFYQCIGQSEHGTTFLRSDGTAEGTQQFTAPSPGSSPVLLGILDGQLIYATAVAEPNAQKIWSFDLAEDSSVQRIRWPQYR